jgi:hypothetical protein
MAVPRPVMVGAIALLALVVAGAFVLGRVPAAGRPGGAPAALDDGGDDAQIRRTVTEGLALKASLWLCDATVTPARAAELKAALARYWSGRRPSGNELATLQAEWADAYVTPDPPMMTEQAVAVLTEMASDPEFPPYKATAIAEYVPPEPNWYPEWSILDRFQHDVDECLRLAGQYPSTERNDEPLTIDNVAIDSDRAKVVAHQKQSWRYVNPSTPWVSFTFHFQIDVVREDGGWRIAEVTQDGPLP